MRSKDFLNPHAHISLEPAKRPSHSHHLHFSPYPGKIASFSVFGCSHRTQHRQQHEHASQWADRDGNHGIEARATSQAEDFPASCVIRLKRKSFNDSICSVAHPTLYPTLGMQQEMPTETNKGQLGFKVSLAVTGPSSSKQMKQEMECVAFFSLAPS